MHDSNLRAWSMLLFLGSQSRSGRHKCKWGRGGDYRDAALHRSVCAPEAGWTSGCFSEGTFTSAGFIYVPISEVSETVFFCQALPGSVLDQTPDLIMSQELLLKLCARDDLPTTQQHLQMYKSPVNISMNFGNGAFFRVFRDRNWSHDVNCLDFWLINRAHYPKQLPHHSLSFLARG